MSHALLWLNSHSYYFTTACHVSTSKCDYAVSERGDKLSIMLTKYISTELKWLKMLSIAVMVIVMGYSISTILTLIFPCSPIKKAWDVTIVEGHCINRGAVYLVQAITNIVTDVILLLLPIPMVWKLQMPVPQKIGLVILFIIGSL